MSLKGTSVHQVGSSSFVPARATSESSTAIPERSAKIIPLRRVEPSERAAPVGESHRLADLYPETDALSPSLAGVVRLLPEAAELAFDAARRAGERDYFGMDDCITRLRAHLPELFACRAIGDGFGMVINAVFWALADLDAPPVETPQANALARVLGELQNRPLLTADDASRLVEQLEDAGFKVEPEGLGSIANFAEGADE